MYFTVSRGFPPLQSAPSTQRAACSGLERGKTDGALKTDKIKELNLFNGDKEKENFYKTCQKKKYIHKHCSSKESWYQNEQNELNWDFLSIFFIIIIVVCWGMIVVIRFFNEVRKEMISKTSFFDFLFQVNNN